MLKLRLGDDLIINDGQHRAAGISAALKENPAIGEHTISVLLFPYENKDRVQQMFSDLNRFVQKTSKSLDILYDKRDPISTATLEAMEELPIFRDLTDKDNQTLKAKSTKLFTLAALYDANTELLKGREDNNAEKVEAVGGFLGQRLEAHAGLGDCSQSSQGSSGTSSGKDFVALDCASGLGVGLGWN